MPAPRPDLIVTLPCPALSSSAQTPLAPPLSHPPQDLHTRGSQMQSPGKKSCA
jgi:hypothetical protein